MEAPKGTKLPFKGMKLQKTQKIYQCLCGTGWMSISGSLPVDSFEQHVKSFQKEQANV